MGFVTDKYCTKQVREEVIRKAVKGEAFLGIASINDYYRFVSKGLDIERLQWNTIKQKYQVGEAASWAKT